ncbi:effector-associated constant component EACC1 [Streptomyces sp. enrichment culture]|uniref:effector-associated constant component EACC1 n=1 Tax=Streptomyces sp. enrichment culture TaxID=1795815 RepID=UPI003F55B208
MGPLIAEVGSIIASVIAASSFGAAITAWFTQRSAAPKTTVTLERDGKTVELSLDSTKDSEDLARILAELLESSDAPDDGESEGRPPKAS